MQCHVIISLENPVGIYLKGWRSINYYTTVEANRALRAKEGMTQYARLFPACTKCWKEQRWPAICTEEMGTLWQQQSWRCRHETFHKEGSLASSKADPSYLSKLVQQPLVAPCSGHAALWVWPGTAKLPLLDLVLEGVRKCSIHWRWSASLHTDARSVSAGSRGCSINEPLPESTTWSPEGASGAKGE